MLRFYEYLAIITCLALQTLFTAVVMTVESGGHPVKLNTTTNVGYTKEQAEAIQRLKSAKDNYDRLGLQPGASRLLFAHN